MFECPEDVSVSDANDHFAEMEEISSYQANYAKLNFGGIPVDDPIKGELMNQLMSPSPSPYFIDVLIFISQQTSLILNYSLP